MRADADPVSVMKFCGNCSCGCPELLLDQHAPADRQVVIADDFGQRIHMSLDQFGDMIEKARSGALDEAILAAAS